MFLFTFEGNIQCAIKVLRLAMEHADGAKCKIVFTSPETMKEFSGKKKENLPLALVKKTHLSYVNLESFEKVKVFFP